MAQDTALSRRGRGFEPPRERHSADKPTPGSRTDAPESDGVPAARGVAALPGRLFTPEVRSDGTRPRLDVIQRTVFTHTR